MYLYFDEINTHNTTQIAEHEINDPSWEDLFEALNKLDQKRHTLLSLNRDEESLMIGGGPEQYVAVRITEFTSHSLLLNGTKKVDLTSQLCVGGQVGDYPNNMLVPKDIAEKVIRSFFYNEASDLSWVED